MNAEHESKTSLWRRFIGWLNEDDKNANHNSSKLELNRIKLDLPKERGDTDILLSQKQKETLQEAVDTAFYSRETSFYTRGSGGSSGGGGGGKDDLMI